MGITNRIFRILRSHMGESGNRQPFSKVDPGFNADDSTDEKPNPTHQDPELAGYYANLEIPYGSDLGTVKTAWKNLVRKYHPDLHSNDAHRRTTAETLTQGLNHAYHQLEKHLKSR